VHVRGSTPIGARSRTPVVRVATAPWESLVPLLRLVLLDRQGSADELR
jgi:hypothetical protein